jgi:hypothetical protein
MHYSYEGLHYTLLFLFLFWLSFTDYLDKVDLGKSLFWKKSILENYAA